MAIDYKKVYEYAKELNTAAKKANTTTIDSNKQKKNSSNNTIYNAFSLSENVSIITLNRILQ